MASSRKKVIVRRFTPGLLPGYLPSTSFVAHDPAPGHIDLLDLTGRVQPVPLPDIKHICFVRDFNLVDTVQPERLGRKSFLGRPRTEGLWIRASLRDDDLIEGLAPLDLALADNLLEDSGLFLIPPDIRGNTQRIFLPRSAIAAMQIVAVVTTPSRRPAPLRPGKHDDQPVLFLPDPPPGSRPQ